MRQAGLSRTPSPLVDTAIFELCLGEGQRHMLCADMSYVYAATCEIRPLIAKA